MIVLDFYDPQLLTIYACAWQGKELFAFERFMRFRKAGGNHCQINALAIPAQAAKDAASTLQRMAGQHSFHLEPLSGPTSVCLCTWHSPLPW